MEQKTYGRVYVSILWGLLIVMILVNLKPAFVFWITGQVPKISASIYTLEGWFFTVRQGKLAAWSLLSQIRHHSIGCFLPIHRAALNHRRGASKSPWIRCFEVSAHYRSRCFAVLPAATTGVRVGEGPGEHGPPG